MCQDLRIENDIVSRGGASMFAGGMGNTGSVCGSVVGALMAIGLAKGRADSMEGMLANLQTAAEFRRRFETEMGSIVCRELTGMDLTTPEGLDQFMNSDEPTTICAPAVNLAHRLAVELLREDS